MLNYNPNHLFYGELSEQDHELLKQVYEKVQREKRAGTIAFAALPHDFESIQKIQSLADELKGKFESVVVIGIGGSDLGARAAFRALRSPYVNVEKKLRGEWPRLYFTGDTTDPEALAQVADVVDWSKTLLVMISKSGNTIEQMSSFVYFRQQLVNAVGEDASRTCIVTITDPITGTLRELTNEQGYYNLVHPAVGGRFSILCAVGLFPLALVGIDIQALCKGAADLDQTEVTTPSDAALYAYHQYTAYKNGQHISVMFPYVYGLREFGFWFRQLWAESLGKKVNRKGALVNSGPTPIAAVGPTDQHSQVQLYMEGPKDKIMTFIRARHTNHEIVLPEAFPEKEGVRYLAGISLQTIITAEQEATAQALAQENRPSVLIEIEKVDEYNLGQLFYFFELATAYAGELFDIDAYDQPGVELGKQLMYKKLGRQ